MTTLAEINTNSVGHEQWLSTRFAWLVGPHGEQPTNCEQELPPMLRRSFWKQQEVHATFRTP